MKFHLMTYGCQMNVYDSDTMADLLFERGMTPAESLDEADLVLVNTCAVRESAQNRIWGILGNLVTWKKRRPGRILGVTGCMAQNEGEAMVARCDYVDLVLGPDGIPQLPELLDEVAAGRRGLVHVKTEAAAPEESLWHAPVAAPQPVRYPRFVSVQKGCNEKCTFCIVPGVRGFERYRPVPHVLDEVRMLVDHGYREVTLIGQTVNAYQWGDADFAELLYRVADVPGLARLRFTTSHPRWITPRLIAALREIGILCEQIHLPMQSGSDRVLRRMKRRYRAEEYFELLEAMRAATAGKPEPLAVSCDLIVGFPGETEADFQLTLDAVERAQWDSAFTFLYSPRPGTAALRLPESVPHAVAQERLMRLNDRVKAVGLRLNQQLLGRRLQVLVDDIDITTGHFRGRSRSMKTIHAPIPEGTALRVGDMAEVEVAAAAPHHLKGRVVQEELCEAQGD